MSSVTEPVSVKIFDKELTIGCKADEKKALLESVDFLNGKIREIRDSGKVFGNEKIAIMTALNITHELLQLKSTGVVSAPGIAQTTGSDHAQTPIEAINRLEALNKRLNLFLLENS